MAGIPKSNKNCRSLWLVWGGCVILGSEPKVRRRDWRQKRPDRVRVAGEPIVLTYALPLAAALDDLRAGALEVVDLIGQIGARIEQVETRIQALEPEAGRLDRLLGEARALQDRFPQPQQRPPLYGAVVGVKDIISVDGFATGGGSTLPPELFAGPEAPCVEALRDAGALILGKTVTTEFAYFEPGPTRNPHHLGHTPGGSSSGSAAAVAAGLCPLALGSQTVGSVIRPAAFCGVVGFKPSYGRVEGAGLIDYAPSVDTVGLFTQDVAGTQAAAAVLVDAWGPREAARQPVLGIPEGPYLEQAEEVGQRLFAAQAERLQEGGFPLVRVPLMEDIAAVNQRHRRLIAGEVAQVHAAWYQRYKERYRPRTAATIEEGRTIGAAEVEEGRNWRGVLRQILEAAMAANGIDVWISPSAPGPAPEGLGSTGDPVMNLPWTHAGMPALSLPAGEVGGLPVGLQCTAAWGRDEELLAWGEMIAAGLGTGG